MKLTMKQKYSLTLLASLSMSAWATSTNTTTTATLNTLAQTQQMQSSVEKNLSNQPLVEDKWSEWGLTREDWTRYETLMKGSRGTWTPNIDPLTALGAEARSDAERRRFAELLARKEYQRAEKEIKFQIAYTEAFNRLYPNQLPFSDNEENSSTSAVNRILHFTRTDCGERCINSVKQLLTNSPNVPIDIYVVDSMQNDDKIKDWAMKYIPVEKVRSKQITLNHDRGLWLKYANGKMPISFQIQGDGQWTIVGF